REKGNKVGIKGFTRLENAKDKMKELAHDSDNEGLARNATGLKASSKGSQDGIVTFGDDGRHIEGGTQGSTTTLGDMGYFANGRARNMQAGVETSEGDQLTDVGKIGQGAEFSDEFASGQVADAGNGSQQ